MQAEQATKQLQIEQQKAEQDRVKWAQEEAELQQRLELTLHTSERLQDAKDSIEHEHSSLQELHKQLMTELEQRTGQLPQVRLTYCHAHVVGSQCMWCSQCILLLA